MRLRPRWTGLLVWALMALCGFLALPVGAALSDGMARFTFEPRLPTPLSIEAVAAYIRTLPAEPNRAVLAATGTEVGHWQLVNRAGEPFTASSPAELTRALTTLAPEIAGNLDRLTLYVTEDTLFRTPALIRAWPEATRLQVMIGPVAHRLVRRGNAKSAALLVELQPRLLVDASDRARFHDTLWQLRRPLDRSRIRTLGLEPGGPTTIPRAPRPDTATRRAMTDALDPGHLAAALRGLAGQTVLVVGRIDAGRLIYKPASGPEGSLALAELTAAASEADVNLLVLGSSSARQPGSRNWLWQRIELSNIERAIERTSLGEFLDALAGEPAVLIAQGGGYNRSRSELELRPARDQEQGTVDAITERVSGTWTDLVSETAGRVAVTAIHASLLSAERQAELDRRLLPGIPSLLQFGYLAVIAAGLLALPQLIVWWRRLWPPEAAVEYGNRVGFLAARVVRGLAFALLFLPLAAIPAFAASLAHWAARLLGVAQGLLRRQTSPG